MHAPLSVRPANEASWDDLKAIFGTRGEAAVCWCQRYKLQPREAFKHWPAEMRAERLRGQTHCGDPRAPARPAASSPISTASRSAGARSSRAPAYPGLLRVYRVPWQGRDEDKGDDSVWAVTCFFVRAGYRRRGVSCALARAAVDFARERGARALEAYPMITEPGQEITWGELHVGSRSIFAAAGFNEVSRPTPRRVVMRVEF